VAKGGVIRRDIRWIDREIGRDQFLAEVRERGFHLVETGGQWVVICNRGFFRVICRSNFLARILIFRRKIVVPWLHDASAPKCAANRHGRSRTCP
jgi:hypothetical protein